MKRLRKQTIAAWLAMKGDYDRENYLLTVGTPSVLCL